MNSVRRSGPSRRIAGRSWTKLVHNLLPSSCQSRSVWAFWMRRATRSETARLAKKNEALGAPRRLHAELEALSLRTIELPEFSR